MLPLLLAEALAPVASYGLFHLLIAVVVVAACVALVYVALQQFGVQVPAWFVHVLWIVAVAFVVIVAIRFVMTL